jgi:SAM-dependent methyltransferase
MTAAACSVVAGVEGCKAPLDGFLARNPFDDPLTLGFFYREKMRAIHRVTPEAPLLDILEVGGGTGGLTALLYPWSRVINVDFDPQFGTAATNLQPRVRFVCGDATAVPFEDDSFDAVTMFDVLEHIPDDAKAACEALRVLRPGGYLMASSPNETWRFPYYSFLRRFCPTEEAMFAEWGHVRRGYATEEVESLFGLRCQTSATFISPVTVLCHDIAFSRLPARAKRVLCAALAPVTWLGYAVHRAGSRGTETAWRWQKTGVP